MNPAFRSQIGYWHANCLTVSTMMRQSLTAIQL